MSRDETNQPGKVVALPGVKQRGGNKQRPGKQRARGGQLDKRIDQVEQWLSDGFTNALIYREAKKRWDVQPRTVEDYIAAVKGRWAEESARGRGEARERQIRRLMKLRRDAVKGKRPNIFGAIAVETLLAKIEGTDYQPGDDLPKDDGADVVVDIDLQDDAPSEGGVPTAVET